MFGLFKKQSKSHRPSYKFFISEVEKYRFLVRTMQEASDDKFVLLYHFENTRSETEQLLHAAKVGFGTDRNNGERILLLDGREFLDHQVYGAPEIFVIEIYPLAEIDEQIAIVAGENDYEITFYASIDSPFFEYFGGDRVTSLLQQLGVKPDEVIEHKFINSAIAKAQDKIEKSLGQEKPVKSSLEDWMHSNAVTVP